MLNIAIRAARQASEVILQAMDRMDRVDVTEKSQRDYVFKWDELVQNEIHGIRVLKKANEGRYSSNCRSQKRRT